MKQVQETVEKKFGRYPEKILQFGEGNFLRAFTDWMIDGANERGDYEGSIVLCQPIENSEGLRDIMNRQDNVYTLVMRGKENGKAVEREKVITSVSRCINAYSDYRQMMELAESADLEVIVSNTTEAGIVYKPNNHLVDCPPESFPAKVCKFLYKRFKAFEGAMDKGLLFLPVELIDENGTKLKQYVLQYAREWELPDTFSDWIENANKFTNTLVDRIVTGYPKDQLDYFEEKLGYKDQILVTSELFNLWVIQGKKEWADILPVHKGGANVIWTEDVTPYKKRKVRILNGAHTATVPAALLGGHEIVLELMNDPLYAGYLEKVLAEEVIPTLDLPKEELETFADAVKERFANPFIKHKLTDICLNCASKFNVRCLPSLLGYIDVYGKLPVRLVFSLAAFILLYKTTEAINDDPEVVEIFKEAWAADDDNQAAKAILSSRGLWSGRDLTAIPGLEAKVAEHLQAIRENGIGEVVKAL